MKIGSQGDIDTMDFKKTIEASLFTGKKAFAVPTVAQEVFDVSGADDTVISVFATGIGGGPESL